MSVEKSISLDPRGGGVLFFMFINKRPLNDPIRHLSVSHAQEKFLVSGCEATSQKRSSGSMIVPVKALVNPNSVHACERSRSACAVGGF